jgi:L-amino acid N-acyltransferase YncA
MSENKMQPQVTRHEPPFTIRPARLEDFEEIYDIFCEVLDEGMTYSYTREEMTPERSLAYWMSAPGTHCYVADVAGKVAAMAALRPNRTGRAGHVANASFIVHPAHRGMGIARALGRHVLEQAQQKGYKAMQYNFVVSTNEAAVSLWKSLGMQVVGTLPKGFLHAKLGYVDVFVMHQFLK